jgi:hypothetical protein
MKQIMTDEFKKSEDEENDLNCYIIDDKTYTTVDKNINIVDNYEKQIKHDTSTPELMNKKICENKPNYNIVNEYIKDESIIIKVMKFPPYFTKNEIKEIKETRPDVLLFDNNFITSVDEFDFPDSIIYIDFGNSFNNSLNDVKLPKNLKKIKFGNNFMKTISYIELPKKLEILEFGNSYNISLFCVKLPETLKELILGDSFNSVIPELPNNLEILKFGNGYNISLFYVKLPESLKELVLGNSFNNAVPHFLPNNLEKLTVGNNYNYTINHFVIPENLKYLQINGSVENAVLLNNLPESIKCLEIINCLCIDMVNLPLTLEELTINVKNIDVNDVNNYILNINQQQQALNNKINSRIIKQTNLQVGLKKIKLSDKSLVEYIKLPFDCEIIYM